MTPEDLRRAPVLAIVGAAGSGKSTAMNILIRAHLGLRHLSFAQPLKVMARELIDTVLPNKWPTRAGEYLQDAKLKNEPLPFLNGFSPRQIMQTLGTEWGRKALHEDFWVGLAAQKVERVLGSPLAGRAPGLKIVFDDARFPNEIEMIRAFGGVVLEIQRPDNPHAIDSTHESEAHHATFAPDVVIVNDGTEDDLREKLLAIWPPKA